MAKAANNASTNSSANWTSTQAYVMAVICLAIGVAVGYFLRGSSATGSAPVAQTQGPPPGMGGGQQQPTPEQLKQMADTQAQPLLAQLKTNPNDPDLLANLGNTYYDAQQFKEAIGYYERSLRIRPTNASVRTDMGTAWFYLGDPDKAIAEFESALKTEPTKANALFNLGIVKWQGKMDATGAVAAWEKLLATNPGYEQKAKVEELIAKAKQHATMPAGQKTDKPAKIM
jgi:cytochrome c-type biogenesis protein CcmH/NrfG